MKIELKDEKVRYLVSEESSYIDRHGMVGRAGKLEFRRVNTCVGSNSKVRNNLPSYHLMKGREIRVNFIYEVRESFDIEVCETSRVGKGMGRERIPEVGWRGNVVV